jgi:hypothetical protein
MPSYTLDQFFWWGALFADVLRSECANRNAREMTYRLMFTTT